VIRVGDELTPAQSCNRILARAEGYTYAANVWALCFVQRPFSAAPRQTLIVDSQSGRTHPVLVEMLGSLHPVLVEMLGSLHPVLVEMLGSHPVLVEMLGSLHPVLVEMLGSHPVLVEMLGSLHPVLVEMLGSHPVLVEMLGSLRWRRLRRANHCVPGCDSAPLWRAARRDEAACVAEPVASSEEACVPTDGKSNHSDTCHCTGSAVCVSQNRLAGGAWERWEWWQTAPSVKGLAAIGKMSLDRTRRVNHSSAR
jgi:hypothetical protein